MESGEEPSTMGHPGSDPVLAGTLKRLVFRSEHPRPLDLVPARGFSFLELGEPDRKIITIQCHAPYSAIQSENKARNEGSKA